MFSMPDEQFAACAGYDALTYVNFLKLCLRLTFWVAVFMGIMVLPTNWAAGSFIDNQLAIQDNVLKNLKMENETYTLDICVKAVDGADVEETLAAVHIHRLLSMLGFHQPEGPTNLVCQCRRKKLCPSQMRALRSKTSLW